MTLPPKTIYVDLDDVLCQAARHFLVIVEREFGKQITYEQLVQFDVGHACGLTSGERDALYRIVHQPDELLSMVPIAGAIEVLRHWREQGFDIDIVTGRPPQSYEVSLAWLAKHEIPHRSLTVVDKYSRFATEDTKAITLAELSVRRFCWAVEDSLPMAQFLAVQMKLPVALIDCPWNQSNAVQEGVNRYRDWQTIAEAMSKLSLSERR